MAKALDLMLHGVIQQNVDAQQMPCSLKVCTT